MFCITLIIENGISKQTSVTKAELDFGVQGVLDAAFADDTTLMILLTTRKPIAAPASLLSQAHN